MKEVHDNEGREGKRHGEEKGEMARGREGAKMRVDGSVVSLGSYC